MSKERASHVFGPVPSRRLGRSLGVDLVPFKVCTLDCIYCQVGRTTEKTLERKVYVCVDEVIEDVRRALAEEARPDYITLSGSGEPTLHVYLDEVVSRIKKWTDVPVALLTNGVLFYRPDVRADAALADLVLPSLDAPTAELFERINRPCPAVDFARYVEGLVQFRLEYPGQIWLEIFLLKGINDSDEHVVGFRQHIEQIRPDRVQLNTAVRPTAEGTALRVPPEEMERLVGRFGPNAEIIADFDRIHQERQFTVARQQVLDMLRRRPCTIDDVADGLRIHRNEVTKHLGELTAEERIEAITRDGRTYYQAVP
ncbi:MAG: radical SAM protein [Planctomycetota bacterium]